MTEKSLSRSPHFSLFIRAAPFVIFVLLTAGQGKLGEGSRYWVYLLKTIVGATMVWAMHPWVREMRWKWSWEAAMAGVGVFILWVGLDGWYPSIDTLCKQALCPVFKSLGLEGWCNTATPAPVPWKPHNHYWEGLAWLFVFGRLLGSSLVVPPLEEVFYRSFLYRYLCRPDFESVALNSFKLIPFLLTACIFGLSHYEWLAGILCGMIYHALVIKKNDLGHAMTAHGITNFLLGLWIVWKGAWHFW